MDNLMLRRILYSVVLADFAVISVFSILYFGGKREGSVFATARESPIVAGAAYSPQRYQETETNSKIEEFELLTEAMTEDFYEDDGVESTAIKSTSTDSVFMGTFDESIAGYYKDMLVGTYFISDGVIFDFQRNGTFNGFFDGSNKEVSGYSYKVNLVNSEPVLNIYNPSLTSIVTYSMSINNSRNIVLHFSSSDVYIELDKGR
jgi:hypothetical protein